MSQKSTELYDSVPVSDCQHSRLNARQSRTAEDVERLAARIRRDGFDKTRPLWCLDGGNCCAVFAGGTRLEAARLAGLDTVPVLLHSGFSDEEIRQLSALDNEHAATDVSSPLERTQWRVGRIQVGHRHRQDLGDVEALAASIQALGLLHPLVVTTEGKLVVGGRRLAAVKRLGWESVPVTVASNLTDAIAALRAERDENTCRKELTVTEKVALGQQLEVFEREAAQQRQEDSRFAGNGGEANFAPPSADEKGKSRDKVGEAVGLSGWSYSKAKEVVRAAEAEPEKYGPLRDAMNRTGKINGAFRQLRRLRKAETLGTEPHPLPAGIYDVILADPPWRYDFSETEQREVENHYPTMTLEEVQALEVPAAENAVLFLWATAPKLEEALSVLKAWGFEYKSQVIWDKERIGMGYWARGQHEPLLIGTRGTFSPPEPAYRPPSVLRETRGEHSAKPECVYRAIEAMFPHARRLELFARGAARPGWSAWGNEVTAQE